MSAFEIHPQLLADCHRLGRLALCHLLLHRNAGLPWFILVPDGAEGDLLELPVARRDRVVAECGAVAGFIQGFLGMPKINFAAIGNLVPQCHLHVVGRRPDDPCWPRPVWGNLPPGGEYSAEELQGISDALITRLGIPYTPW